MLGLLTQCSCQQILVIREDASVTGQVTASMKVLKVESLPIYDFNSSKRNYNSTMRDEGKKWWLEVDDANTNASFFYELQIQPISWQLALSTSIRHQVL